MPLIGKCGQKVVRNTQVGVSLSTGHASACALIQILRILVRSVANIADMLEAIEISRLYLPNTMTVKLLRKAGALRVLIF